MAGFLATACYILIFLGNVVGQAMQNIFLPLALSGGADMAVVLIYTSFVYCLFFSILDVILEMFVPHQNMDLNQFMLMNVGFQNSLNGIGAVFGGSSTRTPLTIQMSSSLVVNLMSPFYKLWVGGRPLKQFFSISPRALWHFALASLLYTASFVLVLIDKVSGGRRGLRAPVPSATFLVHVCVLVAWGGRPQCLSRTPACVLCVPQLGIASLLDCPPARARSPHALMSPLCFLLPTAGPRRVRHPERVLHHLHWRHDLWRHLQRAPGQDD